MFSKAILSGAFALLLSTASVSATTLRGLAWATNDAYAPTIGSKPQIKWYHHWAGGKVKQMPAKVEWVPMYHSVKQKKSWNQRKAEMAKSLPKYLLTFNEPDLPQQAGMSPDYAADEWMREIHQFTKKGVKVGSPAIAYNLDWLDKFLKALAKRGGHVDFICIHWYGSWKNVAAFKKYVQTVHTRFGKDIWVPELGITTASKPSAYQVKTFMMQAYEWMDKTGYVKRAAWFGCFQSNQPPDGFATGKNALYGTGNFLSDNGRWYSQTLHPVRREIGAADELQQKRDVLARHNRIAAIAARADQESDVDDEEDDGTPGNDCEEICQLREASLNEWLESNPAARSYVEAEIAE